jgi:superfamily II DNA/RNA helicase
MQSVASRQFPDDTRDDFWTLVSYFNSLRELGGSLVLMQDDVADSGRHYAAKRGESPRTVAEIMELTSRVSSTELKDYLEQLERQCDQPGSCDVVLASNMISVGVDIPRLGVMIVHGQPKGAAEYIQATSRVGRRRGGPGGLVLTIYNNAKARDRSHFEAFCSWHAALYRDVEATSVTPFAPRARQKAMHAALVILSRHLVGDLADDVKNISAHMDQLRDFTDYLVDRAKRIDPDEALNTERELENFLEMWQANASAFTSYWNDKSPNKSLLISAEQAAEIRVRRGGFDFRSTPTPNSMRNVEPGTLFKLK